MMGSIINLFEKSKKAVSAGISTAALLKTGLFERVIKIKYDIPNDKPELFAVLDREVDEEINRLVREESI